MLHTRIAKSWKVIFKKKVKLYFVAEDIQKKKKKENYLWTVKKKYVWKKNMYGK